MLNDEREHVYSLNNPANEAVVNRWAEVLRNGLKNADGSAPEIVVAEPDHHRRPRGPGNRRGTGPQGLQADHNVLQRLEFPVPGVAVRQLLRARCARSCRFPTTTASIPAMSGCSRLMARCGRRASARIRIVGEIDDPATQRQVIDWVRASNASPRSRTRSTAFTAGTRWAWRRAISTSPPRSRRSAATAIRSTSICW